MRSSSCLFVAVVLSASAHAQQQSAPAYQIVNCIKLQPGKTTADFRQFVSEASLKMAQHRIDAGHILSWSLLRSVIPAGEEARCDFIMSSLSETPPRPTAPQQLAADLEKANIKMTADEFLARRNSLTRLVSTELWRPLIRVGQPAKGNYLFVNYMRVTNQAEYNKFEHDVWKPMAEAWIKDGTMTGWLYGVKQLPGGTEVKYPAMSADMFPSSEAALKWSGFQAMFDKIHPGQNYQATMERLNKLRSLAERQMFVVEERVAKK